MLGRPSALALLKDLAAMISDGTGAEHQWAGRSPCGAGRAAHRMSFSLRMRAAGIARVRMTLGTPRSAIAPVVVRYPDGRRTLFEYEVTDTDGETEIRRSATAASCTRPRCGPGIVRPSGTRCAAGLSWQSTGPICRVLTNVSELTGTGWGPVVHAPLALDLGPQEAADTQ